MVSGSPILQKKLCMLGAFSVGKTSLVRRYVESVFSDTYLTTVGVKIDKRTVEVGARPVTLILWDIAGEDEVSSVRMSYLRGSAGYLLVADGTRAASLEVARSLRTRVEAELGPLPFVLLVNKADLIDEWAVSHRELEELRAGGWSVRLTSAKTGAGVEDAFHELAARVTG
jgi:small GTP-binding protein